MDLSPEEVQLIRESRAKKQASVYDTPEDPETPPEATVQAPPPEKTRTTNHSAFVVNLARQYGYSDDDISGMSASTLEARVMGRFDAERRQSQAALADRDRLVNQPLPAPPPPPKEPTADEVDLGLAEAGLSADDVDERLLKILKHQRLAQQKENAKLQKQLLEMQSSVTATTAAQVNEICEAFFAAVGVDETMGKLLGRGDYKSLQGTPAMARRMAIFREAQAIPGDHPLQRKLQMAFEVLYPRRKQAPAAGGGYEQDVRPPAMRPQPARRAVEEPDEELFIQGHVQRPTNRNGAAEPKGERKATQAVKEKLAELGQTDDDFGDVDGFL